MAGRPSDSPFDHTGPPWLSRSPSPTARMIQAFRSEPHYFSEWDKKPTYLESAERFHQNTQRPSYRRHVFNPPLRLNERPGLTANFLLKAQALLQEEDAISIAEANLRLKKSQSLPPPIRKPIKIEHLGSTPHSFVRNVFSLEFINPNDLLYADTLVSPRFEAFLNNINEELRDGWDHVISLGQQATTQNPKVVAADVRCPARSVVVPSHAVPHLPSPSENPFRPNPFLADFHVPSFGKSAADPRPS
jgi:hypothetical protein